MQQKQLIKKDLNLDGETGEGGKLVEGLTLEESCFRRSFGSSRCDLQSETNQKLRRQEPPEETRSASGVRRLHCRWTFTETLKINPTSPWSLACVQQLPNRNVLQKAWKLLCERETKICCWNLLQPPTTSQERHSGANYSGGIPTGHLMERQTSRH